MLPSPAAGPLESPDYGYEPRWEGLRVLVGLEGRALVARSPAGQDVARRFPELARVRAAAEPEWVLLDGELVILLEGRPATQAVLKRRLQARDPREAVRLALELPAVFLVYDILRIGDSWLLDVAWGERRQILGRAVGSEDRVRFSPCYRSGRSALVRAQELGLEAVVAKRLRGRYFPGERTREWLTVRPTEELEAVIGGWTEGRGTPGALGTVLLGLFREGRLVFVGQTGSGLTPEMRELLREELLPREQVECPFERPPDVAGAVHWVRSELVCRVRHQGWTEAGLLRSPTFLGRAADRPPQECRLSALAPGMR